MHFYGYFFILYPNPHKALLCFCKDIDSTGRCLNVFNRHADGVKMSIKPWKKKKKKKHQGNIEIIPHFIWVCKRPGNRRT